MLPKNVWCKAMIALIYVAISIAVVMCSLPPNIKSLFVGALIVGFALLACFLICVMDTNVELRTPFASSTGLQNNQNNCDEMSVHVAQEIDNAVHSAYYCSSTRRPRQEEEVADEE